MSWLKQAWQTRWKSNLTPKLLKPHAVSWVFTELVERQLVIEFIWWEHAFCFIGVFEQKDFKGCIFFPFYLYYGLEGRKLDLFPESLCIMFILDCINVRIPNVRSKYFILMKYWRLFIMLNFDYNRKWKQTLFKLYFYLNKFLMN